jgi:mitochondrial fission protein ELM1
MKQEPHLLHIWRFTDGKPGHQNQSLGLVQALQKRVECHLHEWEVPSTIMERWRWRKNWNLEVQKLAQPQLIIGAGHRTHAMVLRAQRQYGGRSVVLMKPSLPSSWFDLCVIPEHDQVKLRPNILRIRGVLNSISKSEQQETNRGLMLIGGPCRHVSWADEEVIEQVTTIVESSPQVQWSLTTSRRTPESFLKQLLNKISAENLRVTPVSETDPGWVAEKLALSKQVWATSDSVSMLYESITSGASTGVLFVPWTTTGKLRAGLEDLIRSKMVTLYSDWNAGEFLPSPTGPLAEADRVADWIIEQWYAPLKSS